MTRESSPRSKRSGKKQEEKTMQSRIPGWVWLLTIVMAGAFAALLFGLTQVDGSTQVDSSSTDSIKQLLQKQEIPQTQSDAPSEEEILDQANKALEFYKILSDPEKIKLNPPSGGGSQTPPANTPPPANQAWTLQVASFRKAEDANELRADLVLRGLTNAYVEEIDIPDKGTFFRVMVGPIKDRSKMNKAKDILTDARLSPIEHRVTLKQ